MATRIRTLNFLPEVFQTPTNSQFLQASLDQIVDQPNLQKIQGYIGSKFGYGINANDYYVTEPTATRKNYQLDPGVVFTKENELTANDFISYPGINDTIGIKGGITKNNNRLYESQFYSWDSFTNLDPLINYSQYYWLPSGLPAVTVGSDTVYQTSDYIVTDLSNGYQIAAIGASSSINPTLTLLRGGTYTFTVNQGTQFWIQGQPGVTGYSPTQPNVQTRDVYGVYSNGSSQGVVTFVVPDKNAQDIYNFPGDNQVDVISDLPFSSIQGARLSDIGDIDGVTSLAGLTIMFYNTGDSTQFGYINKFYDATTYDQDGGVSYSESNFPGTDLFDNNYEGGFYTEINANFYTISYVGDPSNPTINLIPATGIPINQKITARFGTQYGGHSFYKNNTGLIQIIPYISAPLDTLYYQDGTNPNKVGIIKIVESNTTNIINVETDILGKLQYTSGNGVEFTNGLKIQFETNVVPASYIGNEYYVQGVGTGIQLLLTTDLVVPELSSGATYIPYDTTPYDTSNYDSGLYIPVTPDYITIARNSIDRNAWSRSNRWFHIDVINATATYTQNPSIVTTFATKDNKAKRPIIEFYPNMKLFNSGIYGKAPIDFIDTRTADAFTDVAGHRQYYPDTAAYTSYTATINGVAGPVAGIQIAGTTDFNDIISLASGTTDGFHINDPIVFNADIGGIVAGQTYYIYTVISSTTFQVATTINSASPMALSYDAASTTATLYPRSTTIVVNTADLYGSLQTGQYIQDLYVDPVTVKVLPINTMITNVVSTTSTTTITVAWSSDIAFSTKTAVSIVTANTTLDNYQLFSGARIVFANDTDPDVRDKIYVVELSSVDTGGIPVITLTVANDGNVLADDVSVIFRGYNYAGYSFFYNGSHWVQAQTKTTVNQAPYFDIYDSNGISFGDKSVYTSSSFAGTKLFSYGIGTGAMDSVLGFPIAYSSINNVGDIKFDVTLNSDTFNYVTGSTPVTQPINTGYVYNYSTRDLFTRQLGWQTAVSPSIQYQVFDFQSSTVNNATNTFTCDVELAPATSTKWPLIQVFINNVFQPKTNYTYTTGNSSTTITFNTNFALVDNTPVQILLLSNQVSASAYYQIPINLNNNPLNEIIKTVNVGDIRGQYQSIFYNNPNTVGEVFGSNNYRDLGNMVPWGNTIIQNSASLVLPGAFLRKQNSDLINSLRYNDNQYITYKTLLISTINNTAYDGMYTPAQILDMATAQISSTKSSTGPFFWSDMLPAGTVYNSTTYSFANSLDVSIYPLSAIYNFNTANYNSVLVYLTRTTNGVTTVTQLIRNQDYTVSADSPSLTVTTDLLPSDVITINEYNQTYGSYVPNTPTKLGLFPATIPHVELDPGYQIPTYFIVGHDGSYTKLYGDYDSTTGQLNDFRDQALLEFETRIYNNLKLSNTIPIQAYEVVPGFFRTTDYSYDEWLDIYSESFLNWVGQNRINYKPQLYNRNDQFTYNYRDNGNKLNAEPLNIGYWRGIYQYFYDTSTPESTPWEMIGYHNMPTWWTSRYGAAPYTSDNLILWTDMQDGINYNNGNPVVIPECVRPGLLQVLPVDESGNLLSPFESILGNYNGLSFQKDWIVGDTGPAEFAFRRSSSWPFALMRMMSLMKPAKFYNLAVDVDHYKYNAEFNQYLLNNRSHLQMTDIDVYGSGAAVTSYINWIVDYQKQVGTAATSEITKLLNNLDVRLVYRLAGFSDKQKLNFYVEKGTPNSTNSSLLIPDESYSLLLYDNQPSDRIVYSGVVVQITPDGYRVYGNSQTQAYFTISVPKQSVNTTNIDVENISTKICKEYYDKTTIVPYGTILYTPQEVVQFLASYGDHLVKQGMLFDDIQNGMSINWQQMIVEFLYWSQMGWGPGSIIQLNPAASMLQINKESNIVQPMVVGQQNFVLNQNLMPITTTHLSVVRTGTDFLVKPLNPGDTIAYGQFNLSSIEHGIVFDNETLFNDTIYNLITGLRQIRIYTRGAKSAEWNGTLDAQGFILNQDNIKSWDSTIKYTKSSIVKYKNRYWSAITIVQPSAAFDETKWQQTNYDEIQKGLLPNSSTNSYESTLYYDVNQANLKNDADLLSFSLIGYRPRDYLAIADLTDITQVNVYQNMIKNKGTLNAASAFKGATLPQGGIDYDIYENWAIQSGEFGGILNNNFIDVKLNETALLNNPSTVALTNGYNHINADMEIPLYSVYNYQRPITDPNVLETIPSDTPSSVYPSAGYVNYGDVKMASFYYSGLPTAVDQHGTIVPLDQLYVRDYVWLANFLQTWQVYTPVSMGSIIGAQNNLNGTVTVTFSQAQSLKQYQPFAIVNFNAAIDGYYIVGAVVDPYRVIINLTLNPTVTRVAGNGVGFMFQSQRVDQPSDINTLPLLNSEFTRNKVWVDTNNTNSWAVYEKTLNYQFKSDVTYQNSASFGSCVAYTDKMGYLIGDSSLGNVYRFTFNADTQSYDLRQTLTHNATFGSFVSYSDDIFAISEPSGNVYVYQLVVTTLVDQINLIQTIPSPVSTTTWGTSTSLSGDKNWLFIGDPSNNLVYGYRWTIQADGSYAYQLSSTLTDGGLVSGDQYGTTLATDYHGDVLVVGAPMQDSGSLTNVGFSYTYNRISQKFESFYNSLPYVPQQFTLASSPVTVSRTGTSTSAVTNRVTVSTNLSGVSVGTPVVFTGTLISGGALRANTVYYVASISGAQFSVSATRGGSAIGLSTASGSMTCTFQVEYISISVNGTLLADNQYAVIGSIAYVYASLTAGDILTVGTNNFVATQTLSSPVAYNVGEQFGQAVDTNLYASEIIVGAPFALDLTHDANQEGAVFRFTNGGNKYGMIIGTTETNVTTTRTIMLNGFAVTLTAGNASDVATKINETKVTNVTATASNGMLVIGLNDNSLAVPNQKLTLQVTDTSTLSELGISLYTNTQSIVCPHTELHSQFGYTLKMNEQDSFVASARAGNRYTATTFDFKDDGIDNDTVFDNNTTAWVDTFANAGAVYMFDYLSNYNESLMNVGSYVYAQSANSRELDYGQQPYYGTALDFNNSKVIVGTPGFKPSITNGLVTIYENLTGAVDWSVLRESGAVVNVEKIQNAQLYSASTNATLVNLDYIDPLQGKLLGAVRQNLDYISNVDPASYNSPATTQSGRVWGAEHVGQLWFNTSATRFVNYHQADHNYNNKWWGKVFPGSNVAVYSFITSNTVPALYQGPGAVFDVDSYAIEYVPNQTGTVTPVYYFWVRNTNIIFDRTGKTLSDTILETYIANPQSSGISYFTPVAPSAFSLYNSLSYINNNDTVLHIGYATNQGDTIQHSQYQLIKTNSADDFLPGLPKESVTNEPSSLYEKMLDSLAGLDRAGSVVPDPMLPLPVQSGVLTRPRQSFFYDRLGALQDFIIRVNEIFLQYPFNEIADSKFLYKVGPTNPSTGQPFYQVSDYVINTNWWAPGYSNSTRASVQVPFYADLATLTSPAGTIALVLANGAGYQETYVRNDDLTWTRIGLQYGTIQLSSALYDYANAHTGFGDNFFDTAPYDDFPSEQTRYIVRAICEEIPQSMLIYRNELLILLFAYIESETIESQNFLPWLNKTSFVDVSHTIRELLPLRVFQSDNQDFLSGYLNEVKPYHVVIKDFVFKYTGMDVFEGDVTDFDVPATYSSAQQQFIAPQLVYSTPSQNNEFLPTSPIWQSDLYSQWFKNHGVSITGQDDVYITNLASYLALNTNAIAVDNASGFPINGVIQIGNEQISYSSVDRAYNIVSGLTRGFNGTPVSNHVPGEKIHINLPAVLLLYGGRGYTEPPKITAYIDTNVFPAPTTEAVLAPVMSIDSLQSVTVLNPGAGYAALPRIEIDPAFTLRFTSDDVGLLHNTIQLSINSLQTGDIVTYTTQDTAVGGITSGQYYYVNVLETTPLVSIALYTSYRDCILDQNRVVFYNVGSGSQSLSVGAIATCITNASPVRENNITLKFDRTSYRSDLTDWKSGGFYGSFYAGKFNYEAVGASTGIQLQSTQPDINLILASASGATFEILAVDNVETLKWSSRTRQVVRTYSSSDSLYPNTININISSGGAPIAGSVGSTVGFYVGMPIKFEGAAFDVIQDSVTYYVESLVTIAGSATGFRIASTYDNAIAGTPIALSGGTVPAAGLTAYPGEVSEQAILTVDYSGIRKAIKTTASNNSITIPISATGFGGTKGFYIGMMLFFVGTTFGGIVENEVYYVTTILDNETFTVSTQQTPVQTNIYGTLTSSDPSFPNCITTGNNVNFNVNDPVIFTNMTDSTGNVIPNGTAFGGALYPNTVYYVSSIIGASHFTVSVAPNSTPIPLTSADMVDGLIVNQKAVLQLTDATGSVNADINLPVSPGQITGQEFTLYKTSTYYTGVVETGYTGLFTRAITQTIGTPYTTVVNRVMLKDIKLSNIYQVYNNMPVRADTNIGNLVAGTTYYVVDYNISSITVTSTSSTGNKLTCDDTSFIYAGMPIQFGGQSLGGISIGVGYFVKSITSATEFTISQNLGGSEVTLTSQTGTMTATGEVYVQLSTTKGGAVVSLLDAAPVSTVTLTQFPTTDEDIAVGYVLGGYTTYIINGGQGYAIDNQLLITGTQFPGGTSPANDLLLTVNTIDSNGAITSLIRTGTPPGATEHYYLKAIDENQLAVYSNAIMTVPVSGINFPYTGALSTTVTALSNPSITVGSTTGFSVNDPVVFTGTSTGNMVPGQTYYILSITAPTTVTISETIGSVENPATAFNTGTGTGFNFTMAKVGDYALLPEPFYFNQSLVKYNHQVYRCVVSNNDSEFIFGKWELLDSGDYALNAMDRAVGYYEPTINMPGLDLTQLYTGVTYPNSTYKGNAFAPDEEFPLDTVLSDQPFYPSNINMVDVLFNGVTYLAPANTNKTSVIAVRDVPVTGDWSLPMLANQPINTTSINYFADTGVYIITANNTATPILISTNGIDWITEGNFTPFDAIPFADNGFDVTSTLVEAKSLYATTYHNGLYVAVGENIVLSTDTYSWSNIFTLSGKTLALRDVKYFNTNNYVGYMAVGKMTDLSNLNESECVLISPDGYVWTVPLPGSLGNNGFNSVATNGSLLVTVGENGVVYTSTNGSNWSNNTTGGVPTLNRVIYANGLFMAVGNTGRIQTSPDGSTWTTRTSGTTENLNGVTYDTVAGKWVVVGNNNVILSSSNAATWTNISTFTQLPPAHTIQGDTFTAGYAPEEMVAGVVSDNLTMIVNTRPGTDWDQTIYQHVGYNVVSKEFTPANASQTTYSFANMLQVPAQLKVFVINGTTKTSTTLYPTHYSINWLAQTITLNTPISIADMLRIDVYGVGNGDQLVKSNTLINPIRLATTGFSELYVNCNYSAPIYSGSGVIRPGTESIDEYAISTRSSDNTILLENTADFVLNGQIFFSGAVFGGVEENVPYYVKSISRSTNRITISDQINVAAGGIAGPTFQLTTATGTMDAIIQIADGTTWTDPVVYYNGAKLLPGHILTVTKTVASTNVIVCNTTADLFVGETVVFSNTMFAGSGLYPATVYYVESIQSPTEFTVSLTSGGPVVDLNAAAGGAYCIVGDYGFGIQSNGTSAIIILAGKADPANPGMLIPYDDTVDYISYTLLGQTTPNQYGYTIPETQYLTGDGNVTYAMTNYNGGDNPLNAIVEVNGSRLTYTTDYTISDPDNTITFTTAPVGNVSITTYNLTDRQYLRTQYGITGKTVSSITSVNNSISAPQAIIVASSVSGTDITVSNVNNVYVGATVYFQGTSFGGISVDGTVYYVVYASSTTLRVASTPGGSALSWSAGSGTMQAVVGGQPAVRVTTSTPHGFTSPTNGNVEVRIDGTLGSTQLNNNLYYIHVINSTQFDLYTAPYDAGLTATNSPVTQITTYISGGYVWNDGEFILSDATVVSTDSAANNIVVDSTAGLIVNTPIVFTQEGTPFGTPIIGNIIAGTVYYVSEISNETKFKISTTHGGTVFVLTTATATGNAINAKQWEQTNVDRLWVTINGLRVPSSQLRINPGNYVSILSRISTSDNVIITSMMPSATPDQDVYIQNVSKSGIPSVYRATINTTTWLTHSLQATDSIIYVRDAASLVSVTTQNGTATTIGGKVAVGVNGDKTLVSNIVVYNNTTGLEVPSSSYVSTVVDLALTLEFSSGVSVGDSLTLTVTQGNLVYINGEQIRFGSIDLVNNTLTNLQRGVNGTSVNTYVEVYASVLSVLSQNRLPEVGYIQTWNSRVYNTTLGDPLQISNTSNAVFLNQGES